MVSKINKKDIPITVYADSLVLLHKKLKKEDRLKAKEIAEELGIEYDKSPAIVVDFISVTSIQKDYRSDGTVIMDAKTACIVEEPLDEVLDAWIEVKNNLSKKQK